MNEDRKMLKEVNKIYEKMDKPKTYWLDTKRYIIVGVFLLIIFFTFMALLYLKADEITKDPCSICAEYMGEKVSCYAGTTYIVRRDYLPNGSITDNSDEILQQIQKNTSSSIKLNESQIDELFK